MSRRQYDCLHCGALFPSVTAHMSHVIEAHDTGWKPREERLRRTWTCWACGATVPGTVHTCPCGFVHPYGDDAQGLGTASSDDRETTTNPTPKGNPTP